MRRRVAKPYACRYPVGCATGRPLGYDVEAVEKPPFPSFSGKNGAGFLSAIFHVHPIVLSTWPSPEFTCYGSLPIRLFYWLIP